MSQEPDKKEHTLRKAFRVSKNVTKTFFSLVVKAAFLLVLLALLLASAGWIFFVKYFNAEQASSLIAKTLRETFDRPVYIGSVKLSFFNGIEIDTLEIWGGEQNPEEKFLSVKRAVARVNPLTLFENTLTINEVELISPKVNITLHEDGSTSLPKINIKKNGGADKKKDAQDAGIINIGGRPFSLKFEDWRVKNGMFTFIDTAAKRSYSVYEVELLLNNLKTDTPSDFKTSFIFRNTDKENISEAGLKAQGRVNLANFDPVGFNLRGVNAEITFLKAPVRITLDMDNIKNPFFSFDVKTPAFTSDDLSFYTNKKLNFAMPEASLKTSFNLKNNYKQISVTGFNISASDIKAGGSGSVDLRTSPFKADFKVKAESFSLESKDKIYPKLKKHKLKGVASLDFILKKETDAFTFPAFSAAFKNAGGTFGKFVIEKADGTVNAKSNFTDISGAAGAGTLHVMDTLFTDIKGTASWSQSKNNFAAAVTALVDGVPIKIDNKITHFNRESSRQVLGSVYLQKMDPEWFIEVIRNFVRAISQKEITPSANAAGQDPMAWLHDIKDGLPGFMANFKGLLTADEFTSPVLSGKEMSAEFDLKNMRDQGVKLNGTLDAVLKNGVIYQLEKKAEEGTIWGTAFQPFILMHRMEKAGSFKVGKVLKDVEYSEIALSVNLTDGDMDIVNFYMDGGTVAVSGEGWVNWVRETLNVNLWTIFKSASRSGAIAENMTDASGVPALAFRVHDRLASPKVEILRPRTSGATIQKATARGIRADFSKSKEFRNSAKEKE